LIVGTAKHGERQRQKGTGEMGKWNRKARKAKLEEFDCFGTVFVCFFSYMPSKEKISHDKQTGHHGEGHQFFQILIFFMMNVS
jgi:hypothetical protein